jgi:hypothetical protein
MLAGSILWGLFLGWRTNLVLYLWLAWLPSLWLVFAVGAVLGSWLPQWVAGRGWVAAAGLGVLAGMIAGLLLAGGFWLCVGHRDLIGLVVNRESGGYASYSVSVRHQLRELAWRALTRVAPVTAVWVAAWTVWTRRTSGFSLVAPSQEKTSPDVRLRFDLHLLRLAGWVAAGFAIFAIAALFLTALTTRGATVQSFLVIGPVAAGLVALGPWLGPLINPGGGSAEAWQWTAVALPVLLGGLAPFALCRRPVRLATAVVAWCGFVTALLFWIAAGAFSLGWSTG